MTNATDVLGEPYTAETIDLPDDHEGKVTATLVHRPASPDAGDDAPGAGRAVLHIHGFSDYFFQTEYAEWWTARGYDFYALDLPKAGRSMLPHQTPHYTGDIADYFPVIDEAWARIAKTHDKVVLIAHSTGGLTSPLWADARRPPELAALVLNSPWFDLQGSVLLRTVGTEVIKRVGRVRPSTPIPRSVSGHYTASLHKDHDGEFDFDLEWKPLGSFTVTTGWLRAIRNAHARLHAGLDVKAPVLVLSSHRSANPTEMGELVHTRDIVLDTRHIRKWSPCVGTHVTYIAVENARHDVFLSRPDVRKQAYAELDRWLAAYGE